MAKQSVFIELFRGFAKADLFVGVKIPQLFPLYIITEWVLSWD